MLRNYARHRGLLAIVIAVVSLATLAVPAATAQPQVNTRGRDLDTKTRKAIDRAIARVYPALVQITVVMTAPGGGRMQKMTGTGSGAIISKDGYIVTNHHVAGDGERIFCRMPDGEEIEAELVGTDAMTDVAVIKLKLETRKQPDKPLPVAEFGDSDKVRVGDTVLAMGCPAALSQSVTLGIVANAQMIAPGGMSDGMRLSGERVGTLVRWIGHDAVIFGGNSGGPLVDLRGRIIGINEVGIGSLGGAIPANLGKSVAEQLIAGGRVKRSWTGLVMQPRLRSAEEETGVLLAGVIEDSPADKAGLKAGDILQSFDGVKIDAGIAEQMTDVNRLILGTPIDKKVKVTVRRDGKMITSDLTTIARGKAENKAGELRPWGITARDFTRLHALAAKRPDEKGVQVHSVRDGGPSGDAKPALRGGDIIQTVDGQPIDDIVALRKLTAEITKDGATKSVIVGFERNDSKLLTVVDVGAVPPENNPTMARKAWLSARTQVLTKDLAKALKAPSRSTGVRVTYIYEDKEAAKAGLQVGDLILKVDGSRIRASRPEDYEVFPTLIRQYDIGAEVEFDIIRDGEEKQIKVKLEQPPTPDIELPKYKDDQFEFSARDLSFTDRTNRKLAESTTGVMITKVPGSGWAALAGLREGDILLSVNGKTTPDVEALETALAELKEKKPRFLVFCVKRSIVTRCLELDATWEDLDG